MPTDRTPSISLTATLARDLEVCPFMAKLLDIDKVIRRPPNPHMSFGNSMHVALAAFFRAGGPSRLPAETLVELLHQKWVDAGFASDEERECYFEMGEMECRGFCEAWQAEDAVFVGAEVRAETAFPCDGFRLVLSGRIDALFERPGGVLEVLDFKTGAPQTADRLNNDIGVPIYWALARRTYPAYAHVLVAHYYLRTFARVVASPPAEGSGAAKVRLLALADRLRHGPFDPTPGPACRWCLAKDRCQPHDALPAAAQPEDEADELWPGS